MEKNMLIEIYPNELLGILIEAGISEQEAKSLVYDILMRKTVPEQARVQTRQPIRRPSLDSTPPKQQQQQYQDEDVDEDEESYERRPVTQIKRSVGGQNMNFSNFGQEFKGLKK